MAREGFPFVLVAAALTGICWLGATYYSGLTYAAVASGVVSAFFVFFFRDPSRIPPPDPGAIVAAGDGRIVAIEPTGEEEYLNGTGIRVSVFLSVFNVHVNRAPMAGTVDFVTWHGTGFSAAYKAEASEDNTQSVIGISNSATRLIVKQIVGVVARRIACYLSPGDEVRQGERFGLIRFGSRVDHILPSETEIRVEIGDRVRAGETIIGIGPIPATP